MPPPRPPGTCSHLATTLDEEFLQARAIAVAQPWIADDALPHKTGAQVAKELAGRLLVRYLLDSQVSKSQPLPGLLGYKQYVTITPYAPWEVISALALPGYPPQPRIWALLLIPDQISDIWGPRRVRFGFGIEYILPNGFSTSALALQWVVDVR